LTQDVDQPFEPKLLPAIASDLSRCSDPQQLLSLIFERLSAIAEVDFCACFLFKSGVVETLFLRGLPAAAIAEWSSASPGGQHSPPGALRTFGITAVHTHPLVAGVNRIGSLSFGTRRLPHFDSAQLETQRAIADQFTLALDRSLVGHELAETNRKLVTASAELARARAELQQIAVAAAHNLREPVRHLNIYTELLERDLRPHVADKSRHYLRFIVASARRLEMLVSDLLRYTGADREQPATQEVDTGALSPPASARNAKP
jgi:signal transduction histidine kinase